MGKKKYSELYKRFGPTALVTGASSGIGKAFAYELASQGFDLVIVARREAVLQDIANDIMNKFGVQVKVAAIDLSLADFLVPLKSSVNGIEIGLVVSNAGDGAMGAFLRRSSEELQKMIELNISAQMQILHYFGTLFVQKNRGGLITVSSTAATTGVPLAGDYSGSKAYLMNLGQALNIELSKTNVHVTVLAPGPTSTPGYHERSDIDFNKIPMPPMNAERVVRGALKALNRNKDIYIPGVMNRVMDFMGRKIMTRRMFAKMWAMLTALATPERLKITKP